MGYGLSAITTRTGDAGVTSLGDGTRVEKDRIRIETVGAVDTSAYPGTVSTGSNAPSRN
jgi:cob(I)alamin adenosyltransferase